MNNKKVQYTKKEFKIDLTWKQRISSMFFTSIIYGAVLFLFDRNQNINSIIFQAIFFGVLFVLIFPWAMKKMLSKKVNNIKPDLLNNETVEEEIFANLFRGIEGVGGKIFLTNERLIFKSHSLNIQKGQTDINYSDIVSVDKRKTAKLIYNGIRIITKQGVKYDFVVNDRNIELQKIQQKLSK
ncbi:GRAM domain-containing protein [Polaribacter sp. MED152]|uniref:GRAM domain-containing protein n=1 Tax=Polaribacter sp. MED152 TaxID=313598 RepID=UPI000068CC23|nr:GRAM domain-containing protein [Polaribacter sp. MED152]EAQ42966.1 hypothetical protein MED152_09590 [Polaribacter sp. MED152]